ncbi:MAG: hypothetical protein KDB12_15300 [Ilumatobacter sp.]|nr:hypothetical protein [Ilumatobacter sp.]
MVAPLGAQSGQSGEGTATERRGRAPFFREGDLGLGLGGAVVATFISMFYSAMLGFNVNEACSAGFHSAAYCRHLDHLALVHVALQAALGAAAMIGWFRVWRDKLHRWPGLWVVIFSYMALALAVTVVYTRSAMDWAHAP